MNCSQIFCTFAVETTQTLFSKLSTLLWIALKFFVLLQSKQLIQFILIFITRCELLSNFLYFCSRNNYLRLLSVRMYVVNCSQIFCTFAVETTVIVFTFGWDPLWIALKFFVLLQSKQRQKIQLRFAMCCELLSNFLYFCSRNNGCTWRERSHACCELLSNFLYFCSRNNRRYAFIAIHAVVNCSQIFCTFAVETTQSKQET